MSENNPPSSSINCPQCKMIVPNTLYCIHCGSKISKQEVSLNIENGETTPCPLCRKSIPSSHNYCHFCGGQIKKGEIKSESENIICSRCWKPNPPNIDYCIHCGYHTAATTSKSQLLEQPFEGFQIDVTGVFKPTMFSLTSVQQGLSTSSRNFPYRSTIQHSKYFGITKTRKTIGPLQRNLGGFGLRNLANFFISILITISIYYTWYSFYLDSYLVFSNLPPANYIENILISIFFGGLCLPLLSLAPIIISIFLVYRNTGYKLEYKLDPSRVFITIIFNFIWMFIGFVGFGPILLRLGDFKVPYERVIVQKSFRKGIALGVIFSVLCTVFLASITVAMVGVPGLFAGEFLRDSFLMAHISTSFFGAIWISLMFLMPLGDYFDKIIKEWNQIGYLILLVISLFLMTYTFQLLSTLSQLG